MVLPRATTGASGVGLVRWLGTSLGQSRRLRQRRGFGAQQRGPRNVVVDQRNNMWIGWTEGATVNVWMSNY